MGKVSGLVSRERYECYLLEFAVDKNLKGIHGFSSNHPGWLCRFW